MAKIRLTKNELKIQKEALKRFLRYLPTDGALNLFYHDFLLGHYTTSVLLRRNLSCRSRPSGLLSTPPDLGHLLGAFDIQ